MLGQGQIRSSLHMRQTVTVINDRIDRRLMFIEILKKRSCYLPISRGNIHVLFPNNFFSETSRQIRAKFRQGP